jgi:peptide/nickel transport system permease protein
MPNTVPQQENMLSFIVRRILQSFIVLIIVTLCIFFAMRLLPGDPILMLITTESSQKITAEEVDLLRDKYGLNDPIIVQYGRWVGDMVHGDFGTSILTRAPVAWELKRRIPVTLYIGLLSFILGSVIGIPLGVISAVRRGTFIDTVVTVLANIGITIPVFWLGYVMMLIFGLHLGWLPLSGFTSPFENFSKSLQQIIMPVICMAIFPIASTARQTRSSMLEVMHEDYIRTAWSKGLQERVVIFRHALKNTLIIIVTLLGLGFSQILGGSVLVETVFVIPGMGSLLVNSIMSQDYPYVQGIVFVIAIAVLLVNLLVDISYSWLDPRIRFN